MDKTYQEQLFVNHYIDNIDKIEQRNTRYLTECYFYLYNTQYKGLLNTQKAINDLYNFLKDKYIELSFHYNSTREIGISFLPKEIMEQIEREEKEKELKIVEKLLEEDMDTLIPFEEEIEEKPKRKTTRKPAAKKPVKKQTKRK